MWTQKYDTNEPIYQTKTGGSRGEINEEFGISRYNILYIN